MVQNNPCLCSKINWDNYIVIWRRTGIVTLCAACGQEMRVENIVDKVEVFIPNNKCDSIKEARYEVVDTDEKENKYMGVMSIERKV